jgi:hypothetical protein
VFVSAVLNVSVMRAQTRSAQTFTLDGRLYSSADFSKPLLDPNVLLNVKILDRTGSCVLYEESITKFQRENLLESLGIP